MLPQKNRVISGKTREAGFAVEPSVARRQQRVGRMVNVGENEDAAVRGRHPVTVLKATAVGNAGQRIKLRLRAIFRHDLSHHQREQQQHRKCEQDSDQIQR